MFGGPLVELVLVLFFVFLTMSAIVSTLQEVVAQVIRARSNTLRRCIEQMLHDDVYGEQIYKRFFRHPRIAVPGRSTNQLTNIDPEDFAVAMATAVQPHDSADDCIAALPASVMSLKDGDLKQRLRLAMPDVFRDGAPPDVIKDSVVAWFNASMNKTMAVYQSSTRMRLYMVAALTTVVFNVSPIKITQALQSQPELRAAFASAVPELSTLVLNLGEGATNKLIGADINANGGQPNVQSLASGLGGSDVQTMLAIFECTRGRTGLPIGWPWMGEIFENVNARIQSTGANKSEACGAALAKAQLSPNLSNRLQMLSLSMPGMASAQSTATTPTTAIPGPQATPAAPAPTKPAEVKPGATPAPAQPQQLVTAPPAATKPQAVDMKPTQAQINAAATMFKPEFGPNFDTDPWYMVLLGWLVMIMAAGQGAPFWFNLLQRMIRR